MLDKQILGSWNIERKGGCRSAPPCVPPLSLCRSDPGSFSPSGFRRRPRWGQLKPSGALPVGADFLPRQSQLSMVAMPLFCKQKSKPLTAGFGVVFRNHRRSKLPRGRAVGTSRRGELGETPNTKTPNGALIHCKQCRAPCRGLLEAERRITSKGRCHHLPTKPQTCHRQLSLFLLVGASPQTPKKAGQLPRFFYIVLLFQHPLSAQYVCMI